MFHPKTTARGAFEASVIDGQEQGSAYTNPHFPTLKEVVPAMLDELLGPLMPLNSHNGLLDLCCGAGEFTLIFQVRFSRGIPAPPYVPAPCMHMCGSCEMMTTAAPMLRVRSYHQSGYILVVTMLAVLLRIGNSGAISEIPDRGAVSGLR